MDNKVILLVLCITCFTPNSSTEGCFPLDKMRPSVGGRRKRYVDILKAKGHTTVIDTLLCPE